MKPYSMDGSIIYCILKNDTKWQKDILQNGIPVMEAPGVATV